MKLDLDEEQSKIIETQGSVVVLAGPGSGKTRLLTEKARRLLDGGKYIICLAFGRSAAREMASRVPGLPATTIHSYACGSVGWKDEEGYDGLLFNLAKLQGKDRFDSVLIDELQDLNELEMDAVLSLVGMDIFAVGDPYQSIYGFQGALGSRAFNLLEEIGCKVSRLQNNYRSTPEIVGNLNRLYQRDLVSKGVKNTGLTCILCRTNDELFYLSKFLRKRELPHRLRVSIDLAQGEDREIDVLGPSSLRLSTIHCSKGLEFDRVILWNWKPKKGEAEEERTFYVAASRASKEFREVSGQENLIRAIFGRL